MKQFALIGDPLGHTLSPTLHKAIYRQLEIDDASYRTIELQEEQLKHFFSGFKIGGFDGINVTIPYKETVIPMLDEIDPKASILNAVNCIKRDGNKLIGFNTDVLGFEFSLQQQKMQINGNQFVILGAGGSAQAVGAALAQGEAKHIYIVNRTPQRAEILRSTIGLVNADVEVSIVNESDVISFAKEIDCVVNTTSVGMYPDTSQSPLSQEVSSAVFDQGTLAFDLIYNPLQTPFLSDAAKEGACVVNGIQMLVAQAVYSVEIWMSGNVVTHIDMNALVRDLEKSFR